VREFEILIVDSRRHGEIYGKSENAIFHHLEKEFSDIHRNPERFLRGYLKCTRVNSSLKYLRQKSKAPRNQ
jgi:hypothetical protein